ncbi:MAG: anhydro-N-acetylmuramic acid kinase [Bacteroidales bacterium]
MEVYKTIGLMSGTSLDGLDIAYCIFIFDESWSFQIEKAVTIPYNKEMKRKLLSLADASAEEFLKADIEFGEYLGIQTSRFIRANHFVPDLISSHGHTIFHQPQNKFTCQIGNGHALFARVNLPVIYDFRSLDVALGGQGAPLVPIGDKLLFKEYDYCLNLGGIANISYEMDNQRIAWDICPVNQVLNQVAMKLGKEYDESGKIASEGMINKQLFDKLNTLDYYFQSTPKSLGREWIESLFMPVLDEYKIPEKDLLATCTEHIAFQISKALNVIGRKNMLITGGGVFNSYLIERIRSYSTFKISVPDDLLINYKEAMIFAFLGVLRLRGEINCLSSVTGASHDSSSGLIIE